MKLKGDYNIDESGKYIIIFEDENGEEWEVELATWVDPNLVKDYPKEYTQEDTYEFWNEVYKELERL